MKLWGCLEQLGINDRYRVKVNDKLSEEFNVISTVLRQSCVLSPLLFSLYINGVVTRLREGKCGDHVAVIRSRVCFC